MSPGDSVRKAIILGASSGIGKELARILAGEGYVLGLAARRVHLLEELASDLSCHCFECTPISVLRMSRNQEPE